MGHSTGSAIFLGALGVLEMGVCYFWPTMLGFVSENLPRTGAVGLNLHGWRRYVCRVHVSYPDGRKVRRNSFEAGYRQALIFAPYNGAPSGSDMANLLLDAKRGAGPEILNLTMTIPIILIAAFAGIGDLYEKQKTNNRFGIALVVLKKNIPAKFNLPGYFF